jgi:hypothetical protein
VRSFALYGETDEFGPPGCATTVRRTTAGRRQLSTGHKPDAGWVNNTNCAVTGCVFGGAGRAAPERALVAVPNDRKVKPGGTEAVSYLSILIHVLLSDGASCSHC